MKNPLYADQDYNLWILLCQTCHGIRKARDKELNQYGVTTEQEAVLYIIQAIGNKATPIEISRWLLREPHTVSAIVGRMEKKGLVRRVKDLDKKNLVRVALTQKGKQAYYQSSSGGALHQIVSSLSEEERLQLRSCLQSLRDKACKDLGREYKLPFQA